MAILGETGRFPSGLMEVLMKQDLRLLFISEDETKNIELKEHFDLLNAKAEVEFTSCERDGCWEADIITVTGEGNISTSLVGKIKEVATQKTVLVISEENQTSENRELVNLLPNSYVVKLIINTPAKEFKLTGNDVNILLSIETIFENAGYQFKNK